LGAKFMSLAGAEYLGIRHKSRCLICQPRIESLPLILESHKSYNDK